MAAEAPARKTAATASTAIWRTSDTSSPGRDLYTALPLYRNTTYLTSPNGGRVPGLDERHGHERRETGPARGREPGGRARCGHAALSPGPARGRAGDSRRARARQGHDLPLVRLARRADRRGAQPGGRPVAGFRTGQGAGPGRPYAPRHLRPLQPRAGGRPRAAPVRGARARGRASD